MSQVPLDLARERYVSLATFRRDGREVRTPVWIAPDGERGYVFSAPDAGKVKRIRANGRARLAACGMRGALHGAWSEARARLVTDATVVARAHRALQRKYGLAMLLADVGAALTGRKSRRVWIEIEWVAADAARP